MFIIICSGCFFFLNRIFAEFCATTYNYGSAESSWGTWLFCWGAPYCRRNALVICANVFFLPSVVVFIANGKDIPFDTILVGAKFLLSWTYKSLGWQWQSPRSRAPCGCCTSPASWSVSSSSRPRHRRRTWCRHSQSGTRIYDLNIAIRYICWLTVHMAIHIGLLTLEIPEIFCHTGLLIRNSRNILWKEC